MINNTLIGTIFVFSFLLVSCGSPTENPKGSLTGVVQLEGETDHSGIVLAVYELAYLDTANVRINQTYPHIGVIINQHTEFDHRLQSPVKFTQTEADGSFELKNISTGQYNVVAIKDGWGFKYINEIEIGEGDNELSDQPELYEETIISGFFENQNNYFLTDHHYIIEDDTELLPNQYLEIKPGAIVRITPGKDLLIHGTLKAQSEENNMFWVTSNDGFDEELTFYDSLQFYNRMELSSIASIEDDLIEWGKWDWGNISLVSNIANCSYKNLVFSNNSSGLYVNNAQVIEIENVISKTCNNSEYGGIVAFNIENLEISKSIVMNNYNGIYSKFSPTSLIENNYVSHNTIGVRGLTLKGNIEHNEFTRNMECDIKLSGNTIEGEITISYNDIYSNTGIWRFRYGSFNTFYNLEINYNNFYNTDWFIYLSTYCIGSNVYATNNFFNYMIDEETISNFIYDNIDNNHCAFVNISGFFTSPIIEAGLE